ncbi:MAG: 1-acyl-sn-glycerol-3-phosphate acyltransferase [Flavobacterium sp.]|jgi:1-acyl-sn-glycerol-3-phosphate acyltransferase
MKQKLYRWIFIDILGWQIKGNLDPAIKKCVFMVLTHTSWHDFFLGLFTRGILQLDMHWVGKKELFRFPFGYYFRWMGGTPLDRSGGLNKVDAIAAIFKKKEVFRMAISPEGTRKKVSELKTGFYYIALKAQVPIVPVAFDFKTRSVSFGEPFQPTGNYSADLNHLLPFFKGVEGKVPENSFHVND